MRSIRFVPFAFALALILAFAGSVRAASIFYGNFPVPPSGISFLDVTESSGTDPVPLFGPPHTFQVGLDFNPTFVAASTNGAADITDGQLNFTVKGLVVPSGGAGINSLSVFEAGDYSLLGLGTVATKAIAAASIRAKVTEIDGNPVAPINLPQMSVPAVFNLIANPGVLQPWSLSVTLPIAAQLTAMNIPFTIGATKVEVVVDDSLNTLTESASSAFIAKKDFVVSADPDISGILPEPASVTLIGLAVAWSLKRPRR